MLISSLYEKAIMSEQKLETKEEIIKKYSEGKTLPVKDDIVFKALFTRGKKSITKAFIENILGVKISKIDLDKNKELQNEILTEKNGRLDIRAVLDDNVECDIEMQLCVHENMLERFLYYWAKIYSANLDVGEQYNKLRKTICIIIVGENIPAFKNILKSHTTWQIREEKYLDIILTPYLQISIIELPKAIKEYEENPKDTVLQWMKFLDNPEDEEVEKIMEENENIKDAKEELDKLRMDKNLMLDAVRVKLAEMDRKQFLKEAREKGLREGIKSKQIEIAKKMLEKEITIEEIIELTGLTEEEIKEIQK